MNPDSNYSELEELSRRGRWLVLSTVAGSGAGHVGGPMSAMDLLISLFFRGMDIKPEEPSWPERDRFILSKGHAAIGLYTVMALRGFFPVEELKSFDKGNSRLQGHPDVTKLPGLETSTGSLGMGLSVGLGFALGAQKKEQRFHTFVMIGDGELQEGMVWEGLHVAPRYQLGNLTAILDWNGLQQFGWLKQQDSDGRGDRRDPWNSVNLAAIFGTSAGASFRSTATVSMRSFRRSRKAKPNRRSAARPCSWPGLLKGKAYRSRKENSSGIPRLPTRQNSILPGASFKSWRLRNESAKRCLG